MTEDDVIQMLRESHLDVYGLGKVHSNFIAAVTAFANLVAEKAREEFGLPAAGILERTVARAIAKEREACAKTVADLRDKSGVNEDGNAWLTRVTKGDCVQAIRARGEA